MNKTLQSVQDIVQQTADAIAAVIHLDVEVADTSFVRIAGTGTYHKDLGCVMEGRRVYEDVVQRGRIIIIEHPGQHPLCTTCPLMASCPEKLEIAMPIVSGTQVLGILGLISFTDKQTAYFEENRAWVIQFIGKMAELIAGNVQDSSPVESASLADLERDAIRDALARVGKCTGRAAKAAKLLGISRATMYRKIQEYKIKIP